MKETKRMIDLVYQIMTAEPATRSSDKLLICAVYKHVGIDINAPFADVLMGNFPPMESITRYRRKVQELCPDLCATEQVEEWRANKEGQYFFWSQGSGENV